jgi:acetolactate synthase-1/2/3 large subunit
MKTQNPTNTDKDTFIKQIKGSDLLVKCLEREGVEVVFAYPGGASMEIHQSLTRKTDKIRTILPRHEQGCGFMAHGYARTTGKAGVCMTTSGPGATNLITCIADAWMDSIPMIAITGQVNQALIGKSAFQETDFYGMTVPITKHSFLVLDPHDLPRVIKEAFYVATTGRPGPVLIDIPKDVQQAIIDVDLDAEIDLPGYNPCPKSEDEELLKALDMITKARQPIIYSGGGIISGKAEKELLKFAEKTGIPVATTLMGLGGFPENHDLSLRWFGMHGSVAGNWAVCDSDLLITVGARFDDRITGIVSKFAPRAQIIHIDIDQSEHNKNKIVTLPIHSDVKYALKRINELMEEKGFNAPDFSDWQKQVKEWRKEHPFKFNNGRHITSQEAIHTLYEASNGDAIIATGVGQHQMWSAQFYEFKDPKTFVSSLGLGTMGFGLPAALGAQVAHPEKTVVDIDGDGSFTMNVQELATAVREKIPAKILLLNNQHLGMVVQWEDSFYDSVRAQTVLCDPENVGGPENIEGLYPDFQTVAKGFGVPSRRVWKREDLRNAMDEMLKSEGPYLLEVIVPYTEHVLPFIAPGASAKEIVLTKED